MFQKGISGNPLGRPKGAKDHKWANLNFWMEKLENEWQDLNPNQRAIIALEAWKTLVKMRPLPPDTPEDSKANAELAFMELKNAERALIESSGNQDGLGDRGLDVHVQADPDQVHPGMGESQAHQA